MPKKTPSKISQWSGRVRDRLARSSRVFLLGLLVACGIEVLVDWNATLFEINVLRDRMRERGYNYVGILAKSAQKPLEARDQAAIATLTSGLFDDEDVMLVRFTTPEGAVVWERVDDEHEAAFEKARGQKVRAWYASQLVRDVDGIVHDPEGLRQRMSASRYRDFAQRWNDAIEAVTARFVGPKPARAGGVVLYQDRLRTPDKQRDDAMTWALATMRNDAGQAIGVVLVAFSMDRTNAAIRSKYLKGLGMVVFFVGLILVQNVLSRRDKLRLLDLETRYGAAKAALREAMPPPIVEAPSPVGSSGALRVAGAIDQAEGAVDGMAWHGATEDGGVSLAVIDPDGDGIDAAAVALHSLRALRETTGAPIDRARAVGAAAASIPLTRPLGILLVRVLADGTIDGVASPFADLRVLSGGASHALERAPIDRVPEGIVGPLERLSGSLPPGALLVGAFGHASGKRGRGLDVDEVAAFVARAHGEGGAGLDVAVQDAVTWARGRATALAGSDVAVVAIARTG